MNYRDESAHDRLLIGLTEALDRMGRLDLLSAAFRIPALGKLELACRRKLFDVELTLSERSAVRIDSGESASSRCLCL